MRILSYVPYLRALHLHRVHWDMCDRFEPSFASHLCENYVEPRPLKELRVEWVESCHPFGDIKDILLFGANVPRMVLAPLSVQCYTPPTRRADAAPVSVSELILCCSAVTGPYAKSMFNAWLPTIRDMRIFKITDVDVSVAGRLCELLHDCAGSLETFHISFRRSICEGNSFGNQQCNTS